MRREIGIVANVLKELEFVVEFRERLALPASEIVFAQIRSRVMLYFEEVANRAGGVVSAL